MIFTLAQDELAPLPFALAGFNHLLPAIPSRARRNYVRLHKNLFIKPPPQKLVNVLSHFLAVVGFDFQIETARKPRIDLQSKHCLATGRNT